MNSCCVFGGINPAMSLGAQSHRFKRTFKSRRAYCGRLVARGALALHRHLRLSGNRLSRRDNDSRDGLFNSLCAAILCFAARASRRHVRVEGECRGATWRPARKWGNWSQELRLRVFHNTADFPSFNSFPHLHPLCLVVSVLFCDILVNQSIYLFTYFIIIVIIIINPDTHTHTKRKNK